MTPEEICDRLLDLVDAHLGDGWFSDDEVVEIKEWLESER